jgi:hypothetical protein
VNLNDLLARELSIRMLLACTPALPALSDLVVDVLLIRPQKEVVRIDAVSRVAVVTRMKAVGDGTYEEFVAPPVCSVRFST